MSDASSAAVKTDKQWYGDITFWNGPIKSVITTKGFNDLRSLQRAVDNVISLSNHKFDMITITYQQL